MAFDIDYMDMGFKLLGVIVLAVVLLFILTWTGYVKCGSIPYWCDAYEAVLGSPRVLIVYGDSGLGDPDQLKEILQSPKYVGATSVDTIHLDRISLGNLKDYKLVIVEHSRKISMDQLQMFVDYVNLNGGRLVWVGDAGVERGSDELSTLKDANASKDLITNAWSRAKEEENNYVTLGFDEFLGLKYVDLTFTHVERTKEFETQERDNRYDSIRVSYNF